MDAPELMVLVDKDRMSGRRGESVSIHGREGPSERQQQQLRIAPENPGGWSGDSVRNSMG